MKKLLLIIPTVLLCSCAKLPTFVGTSQPTVTLTDSTMCVSAKISLDPKVTIEMLADEIKRFHGIHTPNFDLSITFDSLNHLRIEPVICGKLK